MSFGFVLITVLVPLVVAETGEVSPWLARKILVWSARKLGAPEKVERYTEEWLAGLEHVPGKLTKLLHALGVACVGLLRLRARGLERDWQPRQIVSPFDTDSIFGPGNHLLAPTEGGWPTPEAPTIAPALVFNPWRQTHQCGQFCGLECIWNHDKGNFTPGVIVYPPRRYTNAGKHSNEPQLTLVERLFGGVPDIEHFNKYTVATNLAADSRLVSPSVIGDAVNDATS